MTQLFPSKTFLHILRLSLYCTAFNQHHVGQIQRSINIDYTIILFLKAQYLKISCKPLDKKSDLLRWRLRDMTTVSVQLFHRE